MLAIVSSYLAQQTPIAQICEVDEANMHVLHNMLLKNHSHDYSHRLLEKFFLNCSKFAPTLQHILIMKECGKDKHVPMVDSCW